MLFGRKILCVFLNLACFILFLPVYGQYPNILIDNSNSPNEPSVIMDPKNPNNIVAGANIDRYYISTDGGYTWIANSIASSYGVWGDPCIAVDTNDVFYYFHLSNPSNGSWIDRIVCQKLNKPWGNWSDGTYAGLNGSKVQDKEWVYVNRKNNNIYMTWTQFDKYQSLNPNDSSIILFSKSIDNGQSWTQPIRISQYAGDCMDGDLTAEGAMPCPGINDEIYAAWANSGIIYFNRSLDYGKTWLKQDIKVCQQVGSWAIDVPGIYRANGMPVTCSDLSNGPYRGTIYINFGDIRNGVNDNDIWLIKSTDGGDTWTQPKRVNDDPPGNQQFFSWMTVDQTTGYIYIVFYDRRNYNDNRTDVYLAYSTDGGDNFTNIKISDNPFNPNPGIFFGDYTNITAYNGKVIPIWTRLDDTQLSIVCSVINNITSMSKPIYNRENLQHIITLISPNLIDSNFDIELNIPESGLYNLSIFNNLGIKVATLLNYNFLFKGIHNLNFNLEKYNLNKGVYYIIINGNSNNDVSKIILIG